MVSAVMPAKLPTKTTFLLMLSVPVFDVWSCSITDKTPPGLILFHTRRRRESAPVLFMERGRSIDQLA
jgi:hypothetical protein